MYHSFAQAAAAAQAGASVVQIFIGRLRVSHNFLYVCDSFNFRFISCYIFGSMQDWSRNNSNDVEIEASKLKGEDPGISLVSAEPTQLEKSSN